MAQGETAPRDENQVPALLATSSVDGTTVKLFADPTTHRLLTQNTAVFGSVAAQTTPNASVVTTTVGATNSTYWVTGEVNCTAYTSGTLNINIVYTDSTNTVRTVPIQGHFTSGYGVNVSGTGDFEGQVLQVRAKAGTAITVTTTGTFALTYTAYGTIMQVA